MRACSTRNGTFVDGLTAKDFQVLEDGKPQQVTVFSMVNLPVERAQRPLFASQADRARRARPT